MQNTDPDTLRATLHAAAGTGELVRIAYQGGSRPGELRDVVVLALQGQKLLCIEPPDERRKTYALAKISSAERGALAPLPADSDPLPPGCSTLADYAAALRPELEAAGWHVVTRDTGLEVGGFHKNGKPRKGCKVAVYFTDPAAPRMVYDDETGERVMRSVVTGRERPYSVRGLGEAASYRELEPALRRFLDLVRSTSPGDAE